MGLFGKIKKHVKHFGKKVGRVAHFAKRGLDIVDKGVGIAKKVAPIVGMVSPELGAGLMAGAIGAEKGSKLLRHAGSEIERHGRQAHSVGKMIHKGVVDRDVGAVKEGIIGLKGIGQSLVGSGKNVRERSEDLHSKLQHEIKAYGFK